MGLKASKRLNRPAISTGLYLAMGWLVLIAVNPLIERVPEGGLWWLVAAGTGGVVFFVFDSLALRAFRLASVRAGRHRLPLLRRPLVRQG